MKPLWKFILILFGLLFLGLAVVSAFRIFNSGVQPKISLPQLDDRGPARLAMAPLVVRFGDVGGRSVLRNYRIEVEVETEAEGAVAEVEAAQPRLRDAFVVQLLDLSRHAWHSADAPATSIVEHRLLVTGREAVGPGLVKSVIVTEVTESPAP